MAAEFLAQGLGFGMVSVSRTCKTPHRRVSQVRRGPMYRGLRLSPMIGGYLADLSSHITSSINDKLAELALP